MILVKTKTELEHYLTPFGRIQSIGFVPTMGALHDGHLSLVNQSVKDNPVTVVSIFVNPTQFNDSNDLKRYPRNLKTDLQLLETTGCDIVFAPEAEEIYPEPDTRTFDFGHIDKVMEGKHRPGHFNGVAQVVSKLFEIVKPGRAYFGLKDFQQLAIINKLTEILNLPVEIVPCPVVREKSGLAMSSRNSLLTGEEKENASIIYKTLQNAKNISSTKNVKELENWVIETINKNRFLNVEYFEIVDFENLLPVKSWDEQVKKIGCIAVFCGGVRLIDNIIFN